MSKLRWVSMFVTIVGGLLVGSPQSADAAGGFCGVCTDICPSQGGGDNMCAGMGCRTGADTCVWSPLCSNPNHVLVVCDGNVE